MTSQALYLRLHGASDAHNLIVLPMTSYQDHDCDVVSISEVFKSSTCVIHSFEYSNRRRMFYFQNFKHSTFNLGFGILQIVKVTGIGKYNICSGFVESTHHPLILIYLNTPPPPHPPLAFKSQVPAWDSICIWKTHMNLRSSHYAVPYDSKPSIRLDTCQDRWCTHHSCCYQHHGRHYSPQVDLMTDNIKIFVTSKYIC